MALYARNKVWWIDLTHNGKRIQKSTGTTDKIAAQELQIKEERYLLLEIKLRNFLSGFHVAD